LILPEWPGSLEGALSVDPAHLGEFVTERRSPDGRHFILADPGGNLYGSLRSQDWNGVARALLIPIDRDFRLRVAAALRFYERLTGQVLSPLPRSLQLTGLRKKRLGQMLRVLDGRDDGEKPRLIAAVVLDPIALSLTALEWKDSPLRQAVHRLFVEGCALRDGGYLKLLRGDWPYTDEDDD
jgi:hypothetical protein